MNRILLLCIVTFSIIFFGCKKDSTKTNTNTTSTYTTTFSYSLNGVAKSNSTVVTGVFFGDLQISASPVILVLDTSLALGMHDLDGFDGSLAYSIGTTAYSSAASGNSGTFNLTKNDKVNKIVEGTFGPSTLESLTASDSVKITNGVFKVKY